jgi:meiotically up-regulated gene 157 (Mug157) protein
MLTSVFPCSAQWLRDTGNQFAHLYKLLPKDKNLKALVKAVINTESRYISEYPYCSELPCAEVPSSNPSSPRCN